MRLVLLVLLISVGIEILITSCASPAAPTGGPRDTIPPTLLEADPEIGTTYYTGQTVTLRFSERITDNNLKQNLIITPILDNPYKHIIKNDKIILKFENPFPDSTTFSLNFREGIADITEKNPAINLKIPFSTGSYIDSMYVSGRVFDLFEQDPLSNFLVGLYVYSDTLDYFTDNPLYFTHTNDSGEFVIDYVKSGVYKLVGFNDTNKNLLLEPASEAVAFLPDSVVLDSAIVLSEPIYAVQQNIKPIKFINARPTGLHLELKYNKGIYDYNMEPEWLSHSLTGETRDVIRLYKHERITYGDSLDFIVQVYDSLDNTSIDTISSVFIETNRKKGEYKLSVTNEKDELQSNHPLSVKFNKPSYITDSSSFYFQKDSSFIYPVYPDINWNDNNTQLDMTLTYSKDSMQSQLIAILPKDTAVIDEDTVVNDAQLPSHIDFVIHQNSFYSVEGDTSGLQKISLPLTPSKDFGVLKLTVNTTYTNYEIQLVSPSGDVVYSKKDQKHILFENVKSGKYSIRALIDDDQDGVWNLGNLLEDRPPEGLYLYPKECSVRQNWEIEINISF